MWLTLITLKNEVHFPLILLFIMQGTAVDLSLGPGAPCTLAFCRRVLPRRAAPSVGSNKPGSLFCLSDWDYTSNQT